MAAIGPPQQPCQFAPGAFRVVTNPVVSLPPNHVLLCSLCPCGRHRIFFTMHRNLLFAHTTRSHAILANGRPIPPQVHRMEAQLQARIQRFPQCKDDQSAQTDSDTEFVDR